MQAMSAHHWQAHREVLLKFYKAVIRSKLDYGSMFYETAASRYLEKLNKIQNRCLRKTSIGILIRILILGWKIFLNA